MEGKKRGLEKGRVGRRKIVGEEKEASKGEVILSCPTYSISG